MSRPCSVVRDVTMSTVELLEQASQKSSSETRRVFSERGPVTLVIPALTMLLSRCPWLWQKLPPSSILRVLRFKGMDRPLCSSR
jgi:hypothetical protein